MTVDGWAIITLSHKGEALDDVDSIIIDARRRFPKIKIILPSFSWPEHGTSVRVNFLPGYLFAKAPDLRQLRDLVEQSDFFDEVLQTNGKIELLTGQEIDELKGNYRRSVAKDFRVGDQVEVVLGYWVPLEGTIESIVEEDHIALIVVQMEDVERILDVPLFFLKKT
jgi:transcription antitermination factor NusG